MEPGAQHGLVGDSYGIDLPQAEIPQDILQDERKKAKYSRSTEFKKLRAKADERIAFYKTFLPNGNPVGAETDLETVGRMWVIANTLIAELDAIFSEYDQAKEALDELSAS